MSVDQIPVGIDVSKSWFDVCVLEDSHRRSRFDNNEKGFAELLEFLGSKPVHVCLEGTGGYERALCLFLSGEGVRLSMVNALMVRRFGEGLGIVHKTDPVDAWLLAEFCRVSRPAPRHFEGSARRELRQLAGAWKDLQKQLLQVKARMCSPMLPDSAKHGLEIAKEGLSDALKEMWAQIERVLSENVDIAEDFALLCSVPGIANKSAVQILAHLPEDGLRSARSLANYAGVVPCQRESGTSRRGSQIGSRCNRNLRRTLFMCGMVARRFCPHLKAFALRLIAAGKTKKQAIVAIMRKLTHAIFAILTKRETYQGEKLCPSS
jgi:transposase